MTRETKIVLGAMRFGTAVDEATAFGLLDRYVDAGGRMIDTANCYAFWDSATGFGGQSEELLGRWLSSRPGMRDRVDIATKVGCEPTVRDGFPEYAEGLSAGVIAAGIDASLKRLQTDAVDRLWGHMDDRSTPIEEIAAGFGRVVTDGKAGQVGASNFALWRVEQARNVAAGRGLAAFDALQLSHSYLRPRPWLRPAQENHRFGRITDETMDYAEQTGVELWAYSPLLSGAYERDDRPLDEVFDHPGTSRRLAVLREVATELGVSRSQVVLAWMVGGTPPVVPIVGVSSVAQLDDAMAGVRLELSADQRARLDAAV